MDTTKIKARLEDSKLVQQSTKYYGKYKRFLPVVSFFAGFTWDSFTLTRIDLWSDNLILFGYLLLLGLMIIIVNFIEDKIVSNSKILKFAEWYPLGIQFFLGGLFSSYVVFYFQSSALSKNWLFLGLLILILVGNEFIENRLTNLKLQFSLFFLATFSFFIFFIPILLRHMNVFVFLFSGLLSIAAVIGLLYFIYKKSRQKTYKEFRDTIIIIGSLFVLINIFYFLNWIPPVPLALKDAGVYHHIEKIDDQYQLTFEKGSWYQFTKDSDHDFHYQEGDTVYFFAAVFAPTKLNKKIIHHWKIYDERKESWITTDRLGYKIFGGRDGGYRGYTQKRNIQPGKWKVNVETEDGQLLGDMKFEIVPNMVGALEFKSVYR
jgi:hypothetical protein